MKSSMCAASEHENCGKVLQTSSGKRFRCDCGCHPKSVIVKKSVEDEDED